MGIIKRMKRMFWAIRYRIFNRDLYAPLRAGRGTKDNPLTMDDLMPTIKMLNRLS